MIFKNQEQNRKHMEKTVLKKIMEKRQKELGRNHSCFVHLRRFGLSCWFSLMGWMLYSPFPWQQSPSVVSDSWRFLLILKSQQSNLIFWLHEMASGRQLRERMHKGLKNTCTSFYRISWEICQKVSFRLNCFFLWPPKCDIKSSFW